LNHFGRVSIGGKQPAADQQQQSPKNDGPAVAVFLPQNLRPHPLTLLSEFPIDEARQSKIVKLFRHSLQHGGLSAAGGTGQEQFCELGE
jgi:hypothetical protein